MKKFLLCLWQLPQIILARCLIAIYKLRLVSITDSGCKVYKGRIPNGISLGPYILFDEKYYAREYSHILEVAIKHETGHSIQSLYFGPLYLIIIGIPSITQNILSYIVYRLGNDSLVRNYYNRWPENWADKLGNVNRENL